MPSPAPRSPSPLWLLRIAVTIVLTVILLLAVALVTLPMWSDVTWVKTSLFEMVERVAQGPVHMDHMEVQVFPFPRIMLTGVSFASKTPDRNIAFQAQRILLALGWESLWQRRLVLTHGTIQEPELTVELRPDTEPEEKKEWDAPDIHELTISDGRLHLLKASATGTLKRLTWEGIHVTIAREDPQQATTVHLTAQAPEPSSTVSLQGTLLLLERTETAAEVMPPPGYPPFTMKGQMEFEQVDLSRLIAFFSDKPDDAKPVLLSGSSPYMLTMNHRTESLSLSDVHLALNEWEFTGQGQLADMHTPSPLLLVSGSTNAIGLTRLINLLPPSWLPEKVSTALMERQVEARAELLKFSLQGPLNHPDPLRAEGVVQVHGGRVLTAPGHPFITQLSGTVAFEPDVIALRHVQGTLAPFSFDTPQTVIQFGENGLRITVPAFQIKEGDWTLKGEAGFTDTGGSPPVLAVSASAPPVSIRRVLDALPDPWLPASIQAVLKERDVKGMVELVTGSVKWVLNGGEPVTVEGVARLADGQVVLDAHHPPLTQASGSVAFNSRLLRVFDAQGKVGSSELLVKEGTVDWSGSSILADVQGGGNLYVHDLLTAVQNDPRMQAAGTVLDGYRDGNGLIKIATHVQGPLSEPDQLRILQGSLALDQVSLQPEQPGLPVHIHTGHITFDHRRIAVNTLQGQIGQSPLQIQGQGDYRDTVKLSKLTVRSHLAASDLAALFPALSETFSTFSGSLGTILTLAGTPSALSYQTHVDLTKWDLASPGIVTKPAGVPGTLEAAGRILDLHDVILTNGALSLPPFQMDLKGRLNVQDPPDLSVRLRTESGTGSLLPKGMRLGDERLGLSTLAVALDLQGDNWTWTDWNIQGSVESTDRVRSSEAKTSDAGQKIFRLVWMQKDHKAQTDFSVRNLLIERLFSEDSEPRMTGTLTFHTSMDMDLSHPEWVQRFADGKGSIHFRDGRILTSPLLSKILSLLNIHNVLLGKINILDSGFPVQDLTGTFDVKNGQLTTKDLALKSPVLTLAAAGDYFIPTDQIDAVVAVSPFGAYSSLLKSIPLFGTLFEGKRQGLMTALFDVKGPRTDPDVTYRPIDSLKGGILGIAQFPLDVLKNVLTLPVQELNGMREDSPAN